SSLLGELAGNRLNWLVVLLPIAIWLERTHASPLWVFVISALAVVPLAGLIGEATEELALRFGPGLGGLLNATFGNGAELLIGAFALYAGLTDVVKASLSGSIIGNILLVLGLAILVGGWGRDRQVFNPTVAGAQTLTLFLAVVALVMPAVYDLTVLGSLEATNWPLNQLSLVSSLILLCAYVCGLVFSLRTHRDIFSGARRLDDAADGLLDQPHQAPKMSQTAALLLLVIATALTALAAEVLVGSVEQAAHLVGWNDLFVGMIVVAIVGNAAEHFSAVLVARRGNIQLALNIAAASSVQIALLVAPALVLLSWLFGAPMNLVFHPFELFGIALAVAALALVSVDGESNWYEGVLLLAVYALLGIAVYFVPR
ncbi:MAG TPA: calcium/proton exchanger, partial [Chloroflexota bacterium]